MSAVTVIIPERIRRRLEEEAEKLGVTVEEIVVKALDKSYNVLDPEARLELHLGLSEKYLTETEEFLRKEDYVQASEKAWGAAAQVVKAVATKRGIDLMSHRELHEFASKLGEELGDKELGRLWRSATSLHQNFYENWFAPEQVQEGVEDVRLLAEKLKKSLEAL